MVSASLKAGLVVLGAVLILSLSAVSRAQVAPAATQTLRVNISPDGYPPFTILEADGSVSGIMWDVLSRISTRLNYQLKPYEIPRKRVDEFILTDKLDATPRAIEWTEAPERFAFTDPVILTQEVFFSLKSSPFEFDSVKSLRGKTVLTRLGYRYEKLQPLFNSGKAKRFDLQSEHDMFRHLILSDDFQIMIADLQVGLWVLKREGWADKVTYWPEPLSTQGYRWMFRKELKGFVEQFNRELNAMKESGELQHIIEQYR